MAEEIGMTNAQYKGMLLDELEDWGEVLVLAVESGDEKIKAKVQKMNEKRKIVSKLRVRIVAFRDYYYDREDAMLLTNFFTLPEEANKLEAAVKSLQPQPFLSATAI